MEIMVGDTDSYIVAFDDLGRFFLLELITKIEKGTRGDSKGFVE